MLADNVIIGKSGGRLSGVPATAHAIYRAHAEQLAAQNLSQQLTSWSPQAENVTCHSVHGVRVRRQQQVDGSCQCAAGHAQHQRVVRLAQPVHVNLVI